MALFKLTLSLYDHHFAVLLEPEKTADETIILSTIDLDKPAELETDHLYFNPLLKVPQLCRVNSDRQFINFYTGNVVKASKQFGYGWFPIAPVFLKQADISTELGRLIIRSPKLTGIIAQVARQTMGIRVPADLTLDSKEAWIAWICAQKVPLSPSAKAAFNTLRAGTTRLLMTDHVKAWLLSGQEPEPVYDVRIRWCTLRNYRVVKRRLFESFEWDMVATKKLLEGGKEALLAQGATQFGDGWDKSADYATGEDVIELETEDPIVQFPIIHIRPPGGTWKLLEEVPSKPVSVTDLFNQAINNIV
jgi:hypothetical protein